MGISKIFQIGIAEYPPGSPSLSSPNLHNELRQGGPERDRKYGKTKEIGYYLARKGLQVRFSFDGPLKEGPLKEGRPECGKRTVSGPLAVQPTDERPAL